MFIPGCPFHFISLSQPTHSHNCLVTFDANSFVIQELGTGGTIGIGHESHGFYYLMPESSWICSVATSPKLLQEWLRHPHLSKLKIMAPSLEKIKTFFYDSPFPVIHSDIWGSSHVSFMDYRYFVTIIDEFSRCTWVFLMKEGSEIWSIFTSFVNEIKTQFGKTIPIFISDDAKSIYLLPLLPF